MSIPGRHQSLTPYLIIRGASEAIAFYKEALGAVELLRHEAEGRGIVHAEIRVGDSKIMLADEVPSFKAMSPKEYGGSPVSLFLYVEDVDASFDRAVAAGATVIRPVRDEDHGDRMGGFEDPFGYSWWVACPIEPASTKESNDPAEVREAQASA